MVEVADERQHVAIEPLQQLLESAGRGRRRLADPGRHLVSGRGPEHGSVGERGDPLDQQVDDLVAHPAHGVAVEMQRIVRHAVQPPDLMAGGTDWAIGHGRNF